MANRPLITTLVLSATVALGACGFQAHNYDMPDKIGSSRVIELSDGRTAKVTFMHASDIMSTGPCAKYFRTEGYGCTLVPNGEPLSPLSLQLLDGSDCAVWVPPNAETLAHEIEDHCETKQAGIHFSS